VVSDILIDRIAEQRALRDCFDAAARGEPQLVVVHGRRRVGKTYLLSSLARERRAVYFASTRQSEHVELARFAEAIARDLGEDAAALVGGGFPSWEAALRFVAVLGRDEPLLVVLDEATYLEGSTPGFASIVQAWWDHLERPSCLQLVLTGSAIGTLTQMVGADGPLRGRPTLDLRIDPVDVTSAAAFCPRLSPRELIQAWAVCGGYPQHLLAWDADEDFDDNLQRLAGTAGGILLTSAGDIVRESVGDAAGYARVLGAIGRGRTRISAIASDAGQRIEHPVEVLRAAGLVRRELPVGAPRGARATYDIDDLYLRFWYATLFADEQLVAGGQGRAVLARRGDLIRRHVAYAFEEAARAHAVRLVAAGARAPDSIIGRWWKSSGGQLEVDVLGLRGARTSLVGEVKWSDTAADIDLAARLDRILEQVPEPTGDVERVVWAAVGGTRALQDAGVVVYDASDVVTSTERAQQ
jgi:AAA+ ATPase superfamily predicted ATPase